MHINPDTLSHRECVALVRTIYPAGCGFDYKRASLATMRDFLRTVATSYPDAFDAACATYAASAFAPPAPVPPAPVVAPVPPAPAPAPVVAPAPIHTPHAAVPIAAPVVAPVMHTPHAGGFTAPPAPSPEPVAPQPVAPAPVAPQPVAPAPVGIGAAIAAGVPAGVACIYRHVTARDAFPSVRWPDGFDADTCTLAHYASPDAPDVDPDYLMPPAALMLACIALSAPVPMPIWAYGEKGTGKTEFAMQLAARLGRPFYRIQCDRNLERAEFLGAQALAHGESTWRDGALLQAIRRPGALVLFDEPTYLQQANVSILNGVLEMRATRTFRVADTGELVAFADGVTFVAADNTNGSGDPSGRYVGTQELNPATLERFAFFLRFDHLPKAHEAAVLRKRTGAPADLCASIADVFHVMRGKVDSGNLPEAPSMRRAVAFLTAVMRGARPADAFEAAVVSCAVPESAEELRAVFSATWK